MTSLIYGMSINTAAASDMRHCVVVRRLQWRSCVDRILFVSCPRRLRMPRLDESIVQGVSAAGDGACDAPLPCFQWLRLQRTRAYPGDGQGSTVHSLTLCVSWIVSTGYCLNFCNKILVTQPNAWASDKNWDQVQPNPWVNHIPMSICSVYQRVSASVHRSSRLTNTFSTQRRPTYKRTVLHVVVQWTNSRTYVAV